MQKESEIPDLKQGKIYTDSNGKKVFIMNVQLMGNGLAKVYYLRDGKFIKNDAGRLVFDVLSSEITRERIKQWEKEVNGEVRTEDDLPLLIPEVQVPQIKRKIGRPKKVMKGDEVNSSKIQKEGVKLFDFELALQNELEKLYGEMEMLKRKLKAIQAILKTYKP